MLVAGESEVLTICPDFICVLRARLIRGRDCCLVLGLFGLYLVVSQRFFTPPVLASIWWSGRDFLNPQFAESFSNNKIANWGLVLGLFGLYMVV